MPRHDGLSAPSRTLRGVLARPRTRTVRVVAAKTGRAREDEVQAELHAN
jgi:hypothetical protein